MTTSQASLKRQETARNDAQRCARGRLYTESPKGSRVRDAWMPPLLGEDLRTVAERQWSRYCEFKLADTFKAYMDTYIATYRAGRPEGQS